MSQSCKKCFSRIIEELFPFIHYLVYKRRQKKLSTTQKILEQEKFKDYSTLSMDKLEQRLCQEHKRASDMDEKTFKLTLSFSVGLTVLALLAAPLAKVLISTQIKVIFIVPMHIGLLFVLASGIVALGAMRTLPKYGYGTQFILDQQEKVSSALLADALARQETMNIVRHLRNEVAYQSLRNGILLILAGFIIFVVTLVYQTLASFHHTADTIPT